MGITNLERVMWRLRKNNPTNTPITNNELRKIIDVECGTDTRTYKSNRKALIRLGWICNYNKKKIKITNKDITG